MCPHYLATSSDSFSVATLHFLSGLDRPLRPHQGCTAESCSANILSESEYETKHVDERCTCEHLSPDTVKIRNAIEDGNIPIVRVSLRNDVVSIETEVASFDNPYVAISHVWSGGLGNLQTSSLPACQLRRIHHLLLPLMPPRAKNQLN